MSTPFPSGKYIFIWGGLIINAGGMTRAMLKRACAFIQAGMDVTVLVSARGIEQLNGIEHYQRNGYPQISRKNFVIREEWMGERLSDNHIQHQVGILQQVESLCFELANKERIYWKDGMEFARESLSQPEGKREIRYKAKTGETIFEVYWQNVLSRIIADYIGEDGIKHRRERFFAKNGFCHTVFESIWKDTWEIVWIKVLDERNQKITNFKNYSEFRKHFFSTYVNECNEKEIFVFCDPILDFDPGFSQMQERDGKTIYKIAINHGIGFGGARMWNSEINPRIRDNIEKTIVPHMDAFVQLTKRAEDDFRKRLGGRDILHTVPNTVKIPEKVKAFSDRDLNRIVYIGRFEERQKQISHLIRAFAIVTTKYPKAHLHLFGRGESEGIYRRMISELGLSGRVFIEPFTNKVDEEYQRAGFSALSSAFEGMSLSLYESLANGCPVVSYDFKYGVRDGIEDGRNGLLVEPNNIEKLAEKICWMLAHPEKRKEMSENARIMIEKYHEKYYCDNWAILLNALVQRHPYRTFLTSIAFELTGKKYLPILKKLTFSGVLTVMGNVPEIAEGMERIYLRVYSKNEDDYSTVESKRVILENCKTEVRSYTVFEELVVSCGRRITLCLEWNNCFVEKELALWS